jgi:hypothetical protein
MKFWKFAAVAGYVAGIAVALKYAKKTPAQIDADLKKGKDKLTVLWENLLSIHKSALADAKEAAWNETTQAYVEKAKVKLESLVEDFRKEAMAKLEELKLQGKDWAGKAQVELQKIYDHRMEYLAKAKDLSVEAAAKLRAELQDAYQWAKAQVAAK